MSKNDGSKLEQMEQSEAKLLKIIDGSVSYDDVCEVWDLMQLHYEVYGNISDDLMNTYLAKEREVK